MSNPKIIWEPTISFRYKGIEVKAFIAGTSTKIWCDKAEIKDEIETQYVLYYLDHRKEYHPPYTGYHPDSHKIPEALDRKFLTEVLGATDIKRLQAPPISDDDATTIY